MILHTDRPWVARCIGPFIVTGRWFRHLPPSQAHAVIAHERGHLRGRHALKRVGWLFTRRWKDLPALCRQHELEADAFAVSQGHAQGLLLYLASHNSPHIYTPRPILPGDRSLHPTAEQRIMHILKLTTPSIEEAVHGK